MGKGKTRDGKDQGNGVKEGREENKNKRNKTKRRRGDTRVRKEKEEEVTEDVTEKEG